MAEVVFGLTLLVIGWVLSLHLLQVGIRQDDWFWEAVCFIGWITSGGLAALGFIVAVGVDG